MTYKNAMNVKDSVAAANALLDWFESQDVSLHEAAYICLMVATACIHEEKDPQFWKQQARKAFNSMLDDI